MFGNGQMSKSTAPWDGLIEYDPLYCDTIIRRWEKHSGKRAMLADTGQAFEEVSEMRLIALLEGGGW